MPDTRPPSAFAISVVIRTWNSDRTLGRVISGLGLSAEDEVIVVDSGSRDNTLAVARKHRAVIVQASGPFNYSKSLNLGFAAARNPWVLVLSSHAIPMVPNFLDLHRAAMREFPSDVMVGYAPSTIFNRSYTREEMSEVRYFDGADSRSIINFCGNANSIYRKSAWESLAFDENIRTAEDKLWLVAAVQRGWRFAYVPGPRTLNCNQASLRYMFNKGYSDERARCEKELRPANFRPMRLYDLGGALKNLALQKLRGETSFSNWLRYSAHIVGRYFGARQPQNNSPDWKQLDK